MRFLPSLLIVLLCSCWTAEKVSGRTTHGEYVAIRYTWSDLWGPCPKTHDESRLYGPQENLIVRHLIGISESPDGRWSVAQSREPGYRLFLIDHRKGELVKINGRDHLMATGLWAPQGCRLLFQARFEKEDKYGPVILDLDSEEPRFTELFLRPWGSSEEYFSWAPDGRSIAFFNRGPGDKPFELVQYQVVPSPAELQRLALEKVDGYWNRYQIAWKEGRAIAVPRP